MGVYSGESHSKEGAYLGNKSIYNNRCLLKVLV